MSCRAVRISEALGKQAPQPRRKFSCNGEQKEEMLCTASGVACKPRRPWGTNSRHRGEAAGFPTPTRQKSRRPELSHHTSPTPSPQDPVSCTSGRCRRPGFSQAGRAGRGLAAEPFRFYATASASRRVDCDGREPGRARCLAPLGSSRPLCSLMPRAQPTAWRLGVTIPAEPS